MNRAGGDPEHSAAAGGEHHRGGGSGQETVAAAASCRCPVGEGGGADGSDDDDSGVGEDVEFRLLLTVALVVMVMFLFLRNLAATMIPSVAVPISLVGTFGVMYLMGYSLNNLTLMALTISTGFVVDDAIVMIENITRYIEAGEESLAAALKGSAADRVYDCIADHFADCGADSAAVHGRYCGAAVPRVRDHFEYHDSGFGARCL